MPYSDVKTFLVKSKENEIKPYDFREEIVTLNADDDAIMKHMIYQSAGIGKKDLGYEEAQKILNGHKILNKGEADGCELTREIFKLLWFEESLKICTGGDTMNSFFTTFSNLLASDLKHTSKKLVMGNKMKEQDFSKAGNWSQRKMVALYYHNKDLFMNQPNYVKKFLNLTYTIGNLIPVPSGCNSPRGCGNTKDYWDLALLAIYNWYTNDNDKYLYDMLNNKENVDTYKLWLKSFKTWSRFVEANYMQDFVYDSNEHGDYGVPRELWKGHLYKGVTSLPKTPAQIEEYFNNASEWILRRGKRMVEALEKTIQGEQ